MAAGLALPVQGLPVACHQDVQAAGAGQGLQGAVDGGQSDRLPVALHLLVDLLCTAEVVLPRKGLEDRGALAGIPLHGADCPPPRLCPPWGGDAPNATVSRQRRAAAGSPCRARRRGVSRAPPAARAAPPW